MQRSTYHNSKPTPGTNAPFILGDPERKAEAIRSKDTIPLLNPVEHDLLEISRQTGMLFAGILQRESSMLFRSGGLKKLIYRYVQYKSVSSLDIRLTSTL